MNHLYLGIPKGQWLWISGRAVASDIRDSNRVVGKIHLLSNVFIEKTKIKKKGPEMALHFKKNL